MNRGAGCRVGQASSLSAPNRQDACTTLSEVHGTAHIRVASHRLARIFHTPSAESGDSAYRDWTGDVVGRVPSRGGASPIQSACEISGLALQETELCRRLARHDYCTSGPRGLAAFWQSCRREITSRSAGHGWALFILVASCVVCRAQNTNAPARPDYPSFKIITERNIFDPNRSSRSGGRSEQRRPARVESFALVGT